jgi:hypothetical protein
MSDTSPIVLNKAEFPYLIQQENVPIRTLVTLTRTRRDEWEHEDKTLFYLVNGTLEVTEEDRPSLIKVNHTFATDDEDDTAKIAWFELQLVKFVSSYGHHMNFRGLLTEVKFWPEVKGVENPFMGAVEKKGRTEHGYSKNTGYPYTPPNVDIPRLKLPLVVDISFDAADPERYAKWLKKAMASHRKERREREAKARQAAAEKAKKDKERAERRARAQAWLKTPEGQEYEALHRHVRSLPTYNEREAWMKGTTEGGRYQDLQNVLYEIE